VDRGIVGVACVTLGGAAFGCASSTQSAVSTAIRDLNGIECPDENVRILETRDADDDTVYVVDACGKRVEIVKGLALPESRRGREEEKKKRRRGTGGTQAPTDAA
jgi:hypothetical protein